jgi:hypothetical protein
VCTHNHPSHGQGLLLGNWAVISLAVLTGSPEYEQRKIQQPEKVVGEGTWLLGAGSCVVLCVRCGSTAHSLQFRVGSLSPMTVWFQQVTQPL